MGAGIFEYTYMMFPPLPENMALPTSQGQREGILANRQDGSAATYYAAQLTKGQGNDY